MRQEIVVWIDDSYDIPGCHRVVWNTWRIQSKLDLSRFVFTRAKNLPVPRKWKGAFPVSASLAAKLAAFDEAVKKRRPILFVCAHSFLGKTLPDLLPLLEGIRIGSIDPDLSSSGLFFIGPDADLAGFSEMQKAARRASLTQAQDLAAVFFQKLTKQHLASLENIFFDLRHFPGRPWYACSAAAGLHWMELFRQAVQDGKYSVQLLKKEIVKGEIRPSLLTEYISSPVRDQVWFLAAEQLDQMFVPPELRPTRREIRRLYSWQVGLRGYWLRFENSVRIKGFFRTLAALAFKAVRAALKRLRAVITRPFR